MELSDLRIFQAVVMSGGISSAATLLNRVPSNITARIKKLEHELNKALFIREKNRLRISPAGKQLLNYSKKILSLADEAIEQLNDKLPQGKLRVGSMEAVAASRLSSTLSDYHDTYPKVEIEVNTNPTGILIEQTLKGELDLALVADPSPDPRLEIIPIFIEKLVLVSNRKHGEIKSPADLGINPTLIAFSTHCAYRNRLTDWVKRSKLTTRVIEIHSYHALLNCITAGMGVGLVPEILLEQYPFKDGLHLHPFPEHLQQTITCAIWRKDSVKPNLMAFVEALKLTSNYAPNLISGDTRALESMK